MSKTKAMEASTTEQPDRIRFYGMHGWTEGTWMDMVRDRCDGRSLKDEGRVGTTMRHAHWTALAWLMLALALVGVAAGSAGMWLALHEWAHSVQPGICDE